MELHYKQEVTVGLLVVTALIILVGGLAFLSGKSLFGNRMLTVGVQLENVSGLVGGDPVLISGVRVGRVAGIRLRGVKDVLLLLEDVIDPPFLFCARSAGDSQPGLSLRYRLDLVFEVRTPENEFMVQCLANLVQCVTVQMVSGEFAVGMLGLPERRVG